MLEVMISQRISVRRQGGQISVGGQSFPENKCRVVPMAHESEFVGPTGGAIYAPNGTLIGDFRTANVLSLPEGQDFFLLISKSGQLEIESPKFSA